MTTTPRLVEDAARSPLWLDRAGILGVLADHMPAPWVTHRGAQMLACCGQDFGDRHGSSVCRSSSAARSGADGGREAAWAGYLAHVTSMSASWIVLADSDAPWAADLGICTRYATEVDAKAECGPGERVWRIVFDAQPVAK